MYYLRSYFSSTPSTTPPTTNETRPIDSKIDDDWVDLVTKKSLPVEKEWVYVLPSESDPQANLTSPKEELSHDKKGIEKLVTETPPQHCIDNKHQNSLPKGKDKANTNKKHKPSTLPTNTTPTDTLSVNAISPRRALELLLFDNDSKSKSIQAIPQSTVFELKENEHRREKKYTPKHSSIVPSMKVPRVRESKALKHKHHK
eukprot:TRINITY_DN1459_c0_g1_i3.p1 TRINITY_DN1459_c0_g1~~TRINITY_DN1459_c0_g1_i3.p1  ORF type:complete len:201 (-),score=53.33 TRINITY_DN1459_c0_g1_i3:190-792(-)